MRVHRSFRKLLAVTLVAATLCLPRLLAAGERTISNPVAPSGQDPWVIQKDGAYYYCYSGGGAIWVNREKRLEDAVQPNGQEVWRPEPGRPYSKELWAPELHSFRGKWYIYFAADDGRNENHRMYVLESAAGDPLGSYAIRGQLADPTNKWAIDGTVMSHRGAHYFIWSGWEGDTNVQQNLYIARMKGPTALTGRRVLISRPEHPWEKVGRPLINEGPQALVSRAGRIFIIYSASGSWTDDYCLGQLTLVGDNPLDSRSWRMKDAPVFRRADSVFGPGHASFTRSPDGVQDWIVYHAAKHRGAEWNRNIRMQLFTWDGQSNPVFGSPVAEGIAIPAPSE